MNDDTWYPAVNESEVVVPDHFWPQALGVDPDVWAEAQAANAQTSVPSLEGAEFDQGQP